MKICMKFCDWEVILISYAGEGMAESDSVGLLHAIAALHQKIREGAAAAAAEEEEEEEEEEADEPPKEYCPPEPMGSSARRIALN